MSFRILISLGKLKDCLFTYGHRVMRSRNISVSIIIQNVAQLKALFEKQWESIMGNCDEMLYLGGNETGTHKLISESYLGKQTIDTVRPDRALSKVV